jgi:iron(III) transport system permease protein
MNIIQKKKVLTGTVGVVLLLWFLVGYILYPALKTVELSLTDNGAFSLAHYIRLFTIDTSITPPD